SIPSASRGAGSVAYSRRQAPGGEEMSDKAPQFNVPTPGPEHEVLRKDVGTWDVTIEIRMAPGAPPMTSSGVATSRLGCGGMWLISDFENETSGFEGHGVFGWDSTKGTYVGTWVDPMRTFLAVAEGTWDAAKKTMTMHFEASPGGKHLRWKEVTET